MAGRRPDFVGVLSSTLPSECVVLRFYIDDVVCVVLNLQADGFLSLHPLYSRKQSC
jgi:hypothetical protein